MNQTTVLLHGFTGSPAVFDHLTGQLEGRVVRPLLPGHGSEPNEVHSWHDEVNALSAWLESEGVRDAHLVGYSFGGRLAWHLLARDDLFGRATLIGAHPGLSSKADRAARRSADAKWIDFLGTHDLDAFVDRWQSLPIFDSQRSLPVSVRKRQRSIRTSHTTSGLAGALFRLGLAEMPPRPEPRIPVQLVVGTLDHNHRSLAESVGLPLTLIPYCGHNVLLEAEDALLELL